MTFRTPFKVTAIGTVLALATSLSAQAEDFSSGWIKTVNPDWLVVKSDGKAYTHMSTGGNVKMTARMNIMPGGVRRVKNWTAQPSVKMDYGQPTSVPGLGAFKISKSYGVGQRPREVGKNLNFTIPAAKFEGMAVAQCMRLAADLKKGGLSYGQIFNVNRSVKFNVRLNYNYTTVGVGNKDKVWEVQPTKKLMVRCSRSDPQRTKPEPQRTTPAPKVLKSTMQLKEIALPNGKCAVRLTTAISTNQANATIKYQYVHGSGQKSPVYSVKTKANKIAVVTKEWNVPNNPNGPEIGAFWMKGKGPSFTSNKGIYSMSCVGQAPGGFSTGKKPTVKLFK